MTKGEKIKALREKIGLSSSELAVRIDVSKQNMYKYENDIITNIPSDKIELIAKCLNVSPAYIMGWEQNDNAVKEINKPEILYLYDKLDIEDRAEIRGTMKQMLKADKYKQDIHIVPKKKSYSDIYTRSEDYDDDDDVRIAAHKKVSIPPIIDDEGYHT